MIVGSKNWCDYWANFYTKRACKRFSRSATARAADQDYLEEFVFYYLLQAEYWRAETPWA